MKAKLDRYPEHGARQRLLLTPGFIDKCPVPLVEIVTLIASVYPLQAVGMPHLGEPSIRTWTKLQEVDLVEWPRPDWMQHAVELFRPTILLAAPGEEPYLTIARDREIPIIVFED